MNKHTTEPHETFQVVRIDQGWRTGVARCDCGTEYTITLRVDENDHIFLDPQMQICPKNVTPPQ